MVGPKRFLLGGIAVLAFSGAAIAADMPTRGPVYTKAPAAFSWEGQYIGVHGGYAWSRDDITIIGGIGEVSPSGGVIGLQFGYNHHLSRNWVVGYEIDASFGDLNATGVNAVLLLCLRSTHLERRGRVWDMRTGRGSCTQPGAWLGRTRA